MEQDSPAHSVPIIVTMMRLIQVLADSGRAKTISELVSDLGVPRSTVYRIVNTLQAQEWLVPGDRKTTYRVGLGLVRIAAAITQDPTIADLPVVARPFMERAAAETGESVRLSVLQNGCVRTIAVVLGRSESALLTQTGAVSPLPVGASAKVLLGQLSKSRLASVLSDARTVVGAMAVQFDPHALPTQLAQVLKDGWAVDDGEFNAETGAHAAPIHTADGQIIAAVSIFYLRSRAVLHGDSFRSAVTALAASVTASLPNNRTAPTGQAATGGIS